MKKLLVFAVALFAIIGLTACGGGPKEIVR